VAIGAEPAVADGSLCAGAPDRARAVCRICVLWQVVPRLRRSTALRSRSCRREGRGIDPLAVEHPTAADRGPLPGLGQGDPVGPVRHQVEGGRRDLTAHLLEHLLLLGGRRRLHAVGIHRADHRVDVELPDPGRVEGEAAAAGEQREAQEREGAADRFTVGADGSEHHRRHVAAASFREIGAGDPRTPAAR
jgi:hypothetical protein